MAASVSMGNLTGEALSQAGQAPADTDYQQAPPCMVAELQP